MKNSLNRFADLHCHLHMRSFNWFRQRKVEKKKINYHPWHIIYSNINKTLKGKRASSYTQSDPVKLYNGNVKIAFCSLYPMEKGWFYFSSLTRKQLLRIISNPIKYKSQFWVSIGALFRLNKGGYTLIRSIFQTIFMSIPYSRVKHFQSDKYDYFSELIKEREFLLQKNNKKTESLIYIPWYKKIGIKKEIKNHPKYFKANATYEFAKSGKHAIEITKNNKVALIMTMEGANMLNSHLPYNDLKKNIKTIRNWKETPVFFITLAHHFYNFICGHAHSLPAEAGLLINQVEGMNIGISEKGHKFIQELLAIDEKGDRIKDKRRILLDIKHVNIISRKELYDTYIKPSLTKNDIIPIIASHCCFSGLDSIKELIQNMNNETDNYLVYNNATPFYAWNINLCREEIRLIHQTGGIIGINLDQRMLGVPPEDKKSKNHFPYIWNNIKAIIESIPPTLDSPHSSPWDLLAIGSDFDGYIDPANGFPTSLDFSNLQKQLIAELNSNSYLLMGKSPEEIADKLCYKNAENFLTKHFHEN